MQRLIAMMPHNDRLGFNFTDEFTRLYDGFEDKRICLFYLATLLGHRGGVRDRTVIRLFEHYRDIFATASTEQDITKLLNGIRIFDGLSVAADSGGVFEHNADNNPRITPLRYRYISGTGWQWSPDRSAPYNWMPVTDTTVRGGRYNGRSPTQPNIDFIQSLPR